MDSRYKDMTSEIKAAEAAKAGSKEAFCELYGKYKDRLYRYALYRLGNPEEAEDAVSECVLSAWQGLPGLRKPEAFGAWIFRILHACCVKRINDAVKFRENMQDMASADSLSSGDAGQPASLSIELREALSQLSDEERTIVLLSVLAGLTSREISDITGLPPGTVRSRLSRSLAKMRGFLSQDRRVQK